MKKSVWLLCSLGLVLALQGAAQTAPTEAQPQSQAPSALTKPSAPACPLPCLSPEQEAALVEVRKILQEARQVAEGITLPNAMLTNRRELKALEQRKAGLLDEIEAARLRAGDFSAAAGTKQGGLLALAQVYHGRAQDAVQTAGQRLLTDDGLLVLVDLLVGAGDVKTALQVVQASVGKEQLQWWRDRRRATALALIAQRQHERGDRGAIENLKEALKAAQAVMVPEDRYRAFVHVARAQAELGDRVGSAESFRQAREAALAQREEIQRPYALRMIAKAQADSGDRGKSDQIFREAVQLVGAVKAPEVRARMEGCLALAQALSGNRPAAVDTLQHALEFAENLSGTEKGLVLKEIALWQLGIGDKESALKTIEEAGNAGQNITSLLVKAGYTRKAIDDAATTSDDWERAGALSFIVKTLVKSKDSFGTPEVFQELSRRASAILDRPLPNDRSKADSMHSNIALVQAAVELAAATRTIKGITSESSQNFAYGNIINLLIAKGDLAIAQQVALSLRKEWVPFTGAFKSLGKAHAKSGQNAQGLAWATSQPNAFARANALLGFAEGIIDRQGIEKVFRQKPSIPSMDHCPSSLDLMD